MATLTQERGGRAVRSRLWPLNKGHDQRVLREMEFDHELLDDTNNFYISTENFWGPICIT